MVGLLVWCVVWYRLFQKELVWCFAIILPFSSVKVALKSVDCLSVTELLFWNIYIVTKSIGTGWLKFKVVGMEGVVAGLTKQIKLVFKNDLSLFAKSNLFQISQNEKPQIQKLTNVPNTLNWNHKKEVRRKPWLFDKYF